MALSLFRRRTAEPPPQQVVQRSPEPRPAPQPPPFEPAEPTKLEDDPLRRMWQLERFGAIVAGAAQWQQHPQGKAALDYAMRAIDERFALVPEGYVCLPQTATAEPGAPEESVDTAPYLLQRWTVTNAAFQLFLDDGGYENLDYWAKDIWPHIIDFRDQTRQPGPRYWRNGRHNKRLSDHPVVGISYYEAAAYAAWAGYRLPGEPEWQMAASWRIRSPADVLRRYPWGDAFDVRCCNIWATGIGETVPVTAYESGAAPNGVVQLVGNVWEWTNTDFQITDNEGHVLVGDTVMKGVRGGAFDTYFPAQAASSFRTGLTSLARMHNVGFRCALDLGSAGA
jgi:iron(II)-dependent oxidoreductase